MYRNYFLEAVFILLGLGLAGAAIKYPKDVFIKIPIGFFKLILSPIWTFDTSDTSEDNDNAYPTSKKLMVDFFNGEKYIFIINNWDDLQKKVNDFLFALTKEFSVGDFIIASEESNSIIKCPGEIGFYDFHLMVQYFSDEMGEGNSFGLYKSDSLTYYIYQDNETPNNLVGITMEGNYFSLHMLDDLDANQYLKLNQQLMLDLMWLNKMQDIVSENLKSNY